MASSKMSGFKVFLVLLLLIVIAFILVIGTILILSPGVEIFGIKYGKNYVNKVYERVMVDGTEKQLNYGDFQKIIINVENCDVNINSGSTDGAPSTLKFNLNTKGFYKTDTERTEYEYDFSATGTTLTVGVIDPEYSFLQLANNSKISLNISRQLVNDIEFDITTNGGNVTIGNASDFNVTAEKIPISNFSVSTQSGTITLTGNAEVHNTLNLETDKGNIKLLADCDAKKINMKSTNGKISTKSFTKTECNVSIKGSNGSIIAEDINGNVDFDMVSGYFKANKISGDFISTQTMKYTNINIDEITGSFQTANDETGNFAVTINKSHGSVDIVGANKGVILNDTLKMVTIKNTGGPVNITVNENNDEIINIKTKTGKITAKFNIVLGTNTLKTETGAIDVKCSSEMPFYLSAETEGKITRTWLSETIKDASLSNIEVGNGASESNHLNLSSIKGSIKVGLFQ